MKKKTKVLIGIISALIVSVLGGTYAWYVWGTSEEEETKIVTEIGAATVKYDAGANLIGQKIKPVADKTQGLIKNITVKTEDTITNRISFNLYLDIVSLSDGLKHESFKYAFYKGSTLIKEGNFTDEYLNANTETCEKNSTKHIVLLSDETVTQTMSTYRLYVWIDGANYTNPDTMQNQSFNFMLHADGQNAILKEARYPDMTTVKEGTGAHKIATQYLNSTKTPVLNNEVRYYYDTADNLMSDIGGNVRYYGANPNNYIYFNCSDYNNQSADTCELWRIIGVFGDKVKIIRNASLGDYSWDYKVNGSSTSYTNNWSTATLNTLLNDTYYNAGTTNYYNNSTTATVVNFASTGLKNDVTRNMIAEVSWNLGGWKNSDIYSDQIYKYERGTTVYSGRPTSWPGKIAIMYSSDYGYATDFTKCTQNLWAYSSSINSYACRSNDWLYNSDGQWLLSQYSSASYLAWYVFSRGDVVYNENTFQVHGIRPVLHLNSETIIQSGNVGSSSDPYRISVS